MNVDETENEFELAEARERQVFDPVKKVFDYTKKHQENTKVYLPKQAGEIEESELEMIRNLLLEEYKTYKEELLKRKEKEGKRNYEKINQENDNLTTTE